MAHDWNKVLGVTEAEFQIDMQDALKAHLLDQERLNEERRAEELIQSGLQENTFNRDEIVKLAKDDIDMLAALTMPETFQYEFPPVLVTAWSLCCQMIAKPRSFDQLALGIPRGHGKTTFIKLFIVYAILFTQRRFILVLSNTAQNAENILADVIDMLEEPNILNTFGDWRLGKETDRTDLKKFGWRGRNIVLAAIGEGGSVRGLNLKQERPDLMIFDDLQTRECADSRQQSEALERWMIGTAMKAKSPNGCLFLYAGNMFPTPFSILKKLKSNSTWIKFIAGAILHDGSALWPQLRSYDELIAELDNDIAMGHPEIFFSEVLNDTESGLNAKVDFSKIEVWPWGENELAQGRFIVIDPSGMKASSDATAIGLFEIYDGVPGLRYLKEEILSPGNTIRTALLWGLKYNCRLIAVEATAYQSSLLYWFEQISLQMQLTGFHFVEVNTGILSKNSRISSMLLGLQNKKELYIHDSVRSLVLSQITSWNPLKKGNVDGILDLLTYAPKVMNNFGYLAIAEESFMQQEANTAKVLADNTAF